MIPRKLSQEELEELVQEFLLSRPMLKFIKHKEEEKK